MRPLRVLLKPGSFASLDRSIWRLKEIRDSYRELNVRLYGEELANLLNEW